MSDSATPWTAARQASLSITNSRTLLKLMSIELLTPSNHLSSVVPFSSHLQSFPSSGSFQVSQFFTSSAQSIRVSASASVLPMNIQGWLPLGLTGLISLQSKESKLIINIQSVQLLSRVWLFATPLIVAHQASLSKTNSWSLLKLMSIESVMPSNRLILCCPLLLLPPIPPSIRIFSNESTLRMGWPKYWSFSFSISPSSGHPGLIFRMDWSDLLAVQGTLKSLLQHHSSKASIF